MTGGIPANVQNYLGTSQTERPRVQAAEAKEGFGRVLDRQKAEPVKENSPKTAEPKEGVTDAEDVKVPEQPEDVPAEDGKAVGSQEQEPADMPQQPEKGNIGEAVMEPELPAAEENRMPTDMPVADQPMKELPVEDLEEMIEVLQSAIQQIQNLLMQQLELTSQEFEQLMQDEGLTDVQLLQPEIVNQLILDAAGAENPLALVMDETLYAKQQIITGDHREITSDMNKQLGDQEGILPKVLESLQKNVGSGPVQETAAAAESQNRSGHRGTDGKTDSQGQNQNTAGQVFYQNYTSQALSQTVNQTGSITSAAGAAYLETQDSRQIMDQILDYMKVSMKPENTVLDMRLHPESLGTLHIQISARDGVMTAHFTASSEAVKTVLENQMVALKESFLQQDIRVDAIEVTVETHQFESSLEQGEQRDGEAEARRPKRRRLNISSLESGEELTETEQILADMMAVNGNSVDYLA